MFFLNSKSKTPKQHPYLSIVSPQNYSQNTPIYKQQKTIPKPTLSKKQLQIRYGIEYRYYRSQMRHYIYENDLSSQKKGRERSHSSENEEYARLKQIEMINLKNFHEQEEQRGKREGISKKNVFRRLRIKTDHSTIIKTQNSQKSIDRLSYLTPYVNEPMKKKKQKYPNKHKFKTNPHRTLTVQGRQKPTTQSRQKNVHTPKIRQLSELKHYKF